MNIFPKVSPHARSHEFTKKQLTPYQDNSLEKDFRIKSRMRSNGKLFKIKEKFLIVQITKRELFKSRLISHQKISEIISFNMEEWKLRKKLEQESATKIQKHIRGFLARKNGERLITILKKTVVENCVNSMQKKIYSMWIDLKYFVKVIVS